MCRLLHRFLPMLAVLAVACAQVFGLGRGYVCDCGGVEKVTMADHCHGPHSTDCHEHEDEIPCQGEGDHQHEGDSHSHAAVIESLRASPVPALQLAAPPAVVTGYILPSWVLSMQVETVYSCALQERTVWSGHDPMREWSRMHAHTVVMRI